MKKKYGVIVERSNLDDDVINYGTMVSYKINQEGRCEVILQDKEGMLHETYDEFVIYEKQALEDIKNDLTKMLENTNTEIDKCIETGDRCASYLAKQTNNINLDLKKCMMFQSTYEETEKRALKLYKRQEMLERSLRSVMIVLGL